MSEEPKPLVLYDLRSRPPNQCWSSNTWKVRLILNYKGIPYRTEWIKYAEIEESIKPLGVAPNPNGQPGKGAYTVPTVKFPDGKVLMDSAVIANELERRYPEHPVLHIPTHSTDSPPAGSSEEEWLQLHRSLAGPIRKVMAARSVGIVTEESRFKKLEELGGRTPEEIEETTDMEQAWKEMQAPLSDLDKFWQQHVAPLRDEGKLTWLMVYQLSALKSTSIVARDIFSRTMSAEKGAGIRDLDRMVEKKGWFRRDDH